MLVNTAEALQEAKIVAIIRGLQEEQIRPVADALFAGGIRAIEVTFNTPGAANMISVLRREYGGKMLVGAGTVLDVKTVKTAVDAGAEFILSPVLDVHVIEECLKLGKVAIPGAMTPTEIYTAWSAGAGMVKVFPAGTLGAKYIKDVLAPLNNLSLMAVGGVTSGNLSGFFNAGVHATGIGSELVNKTLIEQGDFAMLEKNARVFVDIAASI